MTDNELDTLLQTWLSQLSGIPGALVRPRYQPAPPPQPDQGVNWCAVGMLDSEPDHAGVLVQLSDAAAELQIHEGLSALASFYGPQSGHLARSTWRNMQIDQNRDLIELNGFMIQNVGTIRNLPDLANGVWRRRFDLPINLRRETRTTYGVKTLVDAPFSVVRRV